MIGGGPSLTKDQVKHVESRRVKILGINDAYRMAPTINILYACDAKWWRLHYDRASKLNCEKYSLEKTEYPDVTRMIDDGMDGLSFCWPKLRTGGNSGYQAINLAILLGYKRLILIGYDMQIDGDHPKNQRVHWFGDHPSGLNNPTPGRIEIWIERFNEMAKLVPKDIEIINCSMKTALICFKRSILEEVL